MIINWLLTIVTLGIYYPWARAKNLSYFYGNTALNNERFHFSGTGKEMFMGFVKVLLFYFFILAVYFVIVFIGHAPSTAFLFLYLSILAIIPFAIHSSLRYRMSRISYRGIRFGYRGNRNELALNFFKWILLTIITLGIYGAWMQMNIRRYTHQNIRYGDVEFSNDCDGLEWFNINFKGYIFTILTLGIYLFFWIRASFDYYIDHMKMKKGVQQIHCHSTATAGDFFKIIMSNLLIVIVTLGFGSAWAEVRMQKFLCEHIKMEGNIDISNINQTEEEYTNAMGEDAMDFFEIDLT